MRLSRTAPAVATLVALLTFAAPASATTRTVSNTNDGGAGSLRQTVAASNDGDKVVVPAGTYKLAGSTPIPIGKSIEIQGAGAGATKVVGSGSAGIFDCTATGTLRLTNLRLQIDFKSPAGIIHGAGIHANNTCPLALTGVTVGGTADASGGAGQGGGTIYGAAVNADGDLTLANTHVAGLRELATGGSGSGGDGGTVYATFYASGGLSVSASSFNSISVDVHGTGSAHDGGHTYAMALYHSSESDTTVSNSTFDGVSANANGSGGGGNGGTAYGTLYLSSKPLTLSHVSTSHESASANGGPGGGDGGSIYGLGLYQSSGGAVTADHYRSSGNTASVHGTGSGDGDGGNAYGIGAYLSSNSPAVSSWADAAFERNTVDAHGEGTGDGGSTYGVAVYAGSSGPFKLTRTGVSANRGDATARGTGHGGHAYATGMYPSGPTTLVNVTVAGNVADAGAKGGGSGGSSYGGGVYPGDTLSLLNSTIAGNRVLTSAGGSSYAGNVYASSGTATAKNSIVSGGQAGTQPNCYAPLTSGGHNIEDKDDCGFHGTGDKIHTDPKLGPLANNGGFSLTRRLLPGSPAIDHGDNNGCPSTDQRGFPRGGTCDIGAYEFTPSDLALTMTAPAKVGIGATIAYAVALKNNGPQNAFGTTLVDALGAGLAPAGASFTTGPCTLAQVTSCPLGTVGPGQSVAGHVQAKATALGSVKNTVGFTTFSDDANAANNTASATTKVVHVSASKLKVPKKVKLGKKLPKLQPAAKKKKAKKQYIAFKLNGPATVTLTFQKLKGKKYKSAGKLKLAGHQGKNKLRFAGRLSKKKKLKPGRYRVVLVAVDLTGHKSKKVKRSFKLVRK